LEGQQLLPFLKKYMKKYIVFALFKLISVVLTAQVIEGSLNMNNAKAWSDELFISKTPGIEDFFVGSNSMVVATTKIEPKTGKFRFKSLNLDSNLIYRIGVSRKNSINGSIILDFEHDNYIFIRSRGEGDTIRFTSNIEALTLNCKFQSPISPFNRYAQNFATGLYKLLGARFFKQLIVDYKRMVDENVIRLRLKEGVEKVLPRFIQQIELSPNDYFIRSIGYGILINSLPAEEDILPYNESIKNFYARFDSNLSYKKTFYQQLGRLDISNIFPDMPVNGLFSIDFKKGKPYTLVKFWASWCLPCIKELQSLKQTVTTKRIDTTKFDIIAISLDTDTAKYYAKKQMLDMPWSVALADGGMKNPLAVALKVGSLPASFVVDRNKQIVTRKTDFNTLGNLK
jgi:thiol-disulfide isomerase/thioredoxin